jgi:hypothetical protein
MLFGAESSKAVSLSQKFVFEGQHFGLSWGLAQPPWVSSGAVLLLREQSLE